MATDPLLWFTMKILVLGGTGFIGRHVTQQLYGPGHDVTVFHRGRTQANLPAAVRFILGDRGQLQASVAALQRLAPDVVIDINPYTAQEAEDATRTFRDVAGRLV